MAKLHSDPPGGTGLGQNDDDLFCSAMFYHVFQTVDKRIADIKHRTDPLAHLRQDLLEEGAGSLGLCWGYGRGGREENGTSVHAAGTHAGLQIRG